MSQQQKSRVEIFVSVLTDRSIIDGPFRFIFAEHILKHKIHEMNGVELHFHLLNQKCVGQEFGHILPNLQPVNSYHESLVSPATAIVLAIGGEGVSTVLCFQSSGMLSSLSSSTVTAVALTCIGDKFAFQTGDGGLLASCGGFAEDNSEVCDLGRGRSSFCVAAGGASTRMRRKKSLRYMEWKGASDKWFTFRKALLTFIWH